MNFLSAGVNFLSGIKIKLFFPDVVVDPSAKVELFRIRLGKSSKLTIGRDSNVNAKVVFESTSGEVHIGERCYLGQSLLVCHTGIYIGDDVVMSWGCTIVDHNSHSVAWSHRSHDVQEWNKGKKNWEHVKIKPVRIEDKVWIGFGVSILKGVRVGEGAVIGAGAVITKDVPPWVIVAGNPARVVGEVGEHGQ